MFIRCFIFFLMTVNVTFANENITKLFNNSLQLQTIVGPIIKFIPLVGGFSGSEVYLINDKFVLKQLKFYNRSTITIQKQAAKLGIAPNIVYESPKDRVILMKFLNNAAPVPRDQYTVQRIANFLKILHQIHPKKAMIDIDIFKKLKNTFEFLQHENLSQEILNKIIKILESKKNKYYKHTICHNDLNPNNLLFENSKVIAVDWDTAGLNDYYYDLGTIAMWYINIPDVEKKLLQQYLGRMPKKRELEHLNVMRKIAMVIAGGSLIKSGIQMGCMAKPNMPNDLLPDFLRKIGMGEVNLDSGKELYKFGLIILKTI